MTSFEDKDKQTDMHDHIVLLIGLLFAVIVIIVLGRFF